MQNTGRSRVKSRFFIFIKNLYSFLLNWVRNLMHLFQFDLLHDSAHNPELTKVNILICKRQSVDNRRVTPNVFNWFM